VAKTDRKVGDIVYLRSGFCWYDGDRKWISNADRIDPKKQGNPGPVRRRERCPNGDRNCFSPCCTFQFYYVITHIDSEDDRTRYHVATLAMTEETGYRSGYTFDQGHFPPRKVAKPPAYVVRTSKALLGQKDDDFLR
jgi:hypothetical protein